jgi:hypothetical protein
MKIDYKNWTIGLRTLLFFSLCITNLGEDFTGPIKNNRKLEIFTLRNLLPEDKGLYLHYSMLRYYFEILLDFCRVYPHLLKPIDGGNYTASK